MKFKNWYEFFEKMNGEPIAYLKGKENAIKYNLHTKEQLNFEKLSQNTINLGYKLTKNGSPKGYFKYKTHVEKFNQEIFKGKGIVFPNPTKTNN
jgi:hypothetical protein